jgi:hypothetical protein
MFTSGFITQCGPWIPCLKNGEKNYTFTPQELSELLNKAFSDGYQYAKSIYYIPEVTVSTSESSYIAGETNHGTN